MRRDRLPRARAEGDASGLVGMTPARANSGQAAKRPVAATPGASLPLDASLLSIVANLEGLISMGCAINGAPTWAAKRLPIFHAGF